MCPNIKAIEVTQPENILETYKAAYNDHGNSYLVVENWNNE